MIMENSPQRSQMKLWSVDFQVGVQDCEVEAGRLGKADWSAYPWLLRKFSMRAENAERYGQSLRSVIMQFSKLNAHWWHAPTLSP